MEVFLSIVEVNSYELSPTGARIHDTNSKSLFDKTTAASFPAKQGMHWVGLRLHLSLKCNINRLVLASVIN